MKKFSLIVESYDENSNIARCIDSIKNQTYKNIEIIIVNNNKNIMNKLYDFEQDDNIIIYNNLELDTITKIRIFGLSKAKGDFIQLIDSNDFISKDYIRMINEKIDESDIYLSSYVAKENDKWFLYNYINNMDDKIMDQNSFLKEMFLSKYSNNRYFKMELKCIKKTVIKNILNQYKKIKSSSILEDDLILTCLLSINSDSLKLLNLNEYFLDSNYRDIKEYNELKKVLSNNKSLKKYIEYIDNYDKSDNTFYSSKSEYNDGLNTLKDKIIDSNIEIVSFDMFDTLVLRPFLKPLDMFELLNDDFIELTSCDKVVKFSKMRVEAEADLRIINYEKGINEVSIDEIYNHLSKKYNIKNIDIIKEKEKELEIQYCYTRKTGYELYSLAKDLGKRVIITTDIYLDRKTINKILEKNHYQIDDIYISQELLKTKNDGSIYEFIKDKEQKNILHIGDNYQTDVLNAREHNIPSEYLPKTIDVFLGETEIKVNNTGKVFEDFDMYNINLYRYLKTTGVRYALAIIANKFFDNPFINFMEDTKFNSNPYYIGYYPLGMQLLSLSNWLLKDTGNKQLDSLVFMARDGFLPLKATNILQEKTSINKKTKLDYIYISRKSTLPLIISDKISLNAIDSYLDYNELSANDLIKQLSVILDMNKKKKVEEQLDINKKFETLMSFQKALEIIFDNMYSKEKYQENYNLAHRYFLEKYINKTATFDIGYSGKPELIISNMLKKEIKTYFYHINSSEGFMNSVRGNNELNVFYDFMPTLTGTIRELLYSDTNPSCIGYKEENHEIKPIFEKEEKYTFFNRKMIENIQEYSIKFIEDFANIFGDKMNQIDLNKFYMSIPYEYYCHYSSDNDKLIFDKLIFESNTNNSATFLDYTNRLLDSYYYKNEKRYNDIIKNYIEKTNNTVESIKDTIRSDYYNELVKEGYRILPKRRFARILYYLLFNRKELIDKIKRK